MTTSGASESGGSARGGPAPAERGPGKHGPGEHAGAFPPILTTAQAAELLQVHVEYLRRMVRENRIPAHRFPGGREIRFHRDELIEWVRSQPGHDRSPSRAEVDAEHVAHADR